MKIIIILFGLLMLTYSCGVMSPKLNPSVKYTALSSVESFDQDTIPILIQFHGESFNYEYRKIGLLEFTGGQSDEVVLKNFKYHAWKRGGNAALIVKKEQVSNGQSSVSEEDGSTTVYTNYTNRWTGVIAVVPDSVHQSATQFDKNSSYASLVEKNNLPRKKEYSPVRTVLGVAYFGSLVLLLSMLEF